MVAGRCVRHRGAILRKPQSIVAQSDWSDRLIPEHWHLGVLRWAGEYSSRVSQLAAAAASLRFNGFGISTCSAPNRSVEPGRSKIQSVLTWTALVTAAMKIDDFIFWFIFRCGKGSWILPQSVTYPVTE